MEWWWTSLLLMVGTRFGLAAAPNNGGQVPAGQFRSRIFYGGALETSNEDKWTLILVFEFFRLVMFGSLSWKGIEIYQYNFQLMHQFIVL